MPHQEIESLVVQLIGAISKSGYLAARTAPTVFTVRDLMVIEVEIRFLGLTARLFEDFSIL